MPPTATARLAALPVGRTSSPRRAYWGRPGIGSVLDQAELLGQLAAMDGGADAALLDVVLDARLQGLPLLLADHPFRRSAGPGVMVGIIGLLDLLNLTGAHLLVELGRLGTVAREQCVQVLEHHAALVHGTHVLRPAGLAEAALDEGDAATGEFELVRNGLLGLLIVCHGSLLRRWAVWCRSAMALRSGLPSPRSWRHWP